MTGHECATPETGLPGHTWTCPVCGTKWLAVDDDNEDTDGLFFHWEANE